MIFRHIYHKELAQASYLIGCSATGEALIVDPNRNVDQYIELATQEGLRITAVTETHIHADFVSGTRELAERTGAQVYLSDAGPAPWKYAYTVEASATLLNDGASFMVGNVRVDAVHTPGHTPEHLSFLVTDTAGANEPMGIFTGDFVFVGDVGRPDLLEKAAGVRGTMAHAAQQLYQSLQQFHALPDYVQIWPGHGAGSVCGRALGAVPQTTVGYEKRFNWAFGEMTEAQFVNAVLEGQPAPPPYFAHMKRINREGPTIMSTQRAAEQLTLDDLQHELEAGTLVVDTRAADAYATRHIPGTINLPLNGAFLTWAGWLLPFDQPITLIVEANNVATALQQLHLIGLDRITGYWSPAIFDAWVASGKGFEETVRVDVPALEQMLAKEQVAVIDVRNPQEYATGHIAGSRNLPLSEIGAGNRDIPTDRPVVVHCEGGLRSAIATSLLAAQGRSNVRDLIGGFRAWTTGDRPVTRS